MGKPWGYTDTIRLAAELGFTLEVNHIQPLLVREVGAKNREYVTWLTMYSRLKGRQRMRNKRTAKEEAELGDVHACGSSRVYGGIFGEKL